MSPICNPLLTVVHFCLSCNRGKYYFVHLFQKRSARYWTCFQRSLMYMSVFWNRLGGKPGWHIRISLSRTPLWCEAAGGLKVHLIPFWSIAFRSFCLFQLEIASCSYLLAPTRLVPLSDGICVTWPILLMNRLWALMQESVSKECAIYKCNALLDIQVNMTPYCWFQKAQSNQHLHCWTVEDQLRVSLSAGPPSFVLSFLRHVCTLCTWIWFCKRQSWHWRSSIFFWAAREHDFSHHVQAAPVCVFG